MIRIRKSPKAYLKEGAQTKTTPRIKSLAEKIDGEGFEFIFNLLNFLQKHLRDLYRSPMKYQEYLKKHHLRKTADELLAERLAPTCGEKALIFAAICRAKGIPAKMIEGALYEFLEDQSDEHVRTHAFVEIFVGRRWYLVDPSRGLIGVNKTLQTFFPPYARWEPLWEGLDFWDMGFFDHETFMEQAVEFKHKWRRKKRLPPSSQG